MTAIWDDCGFHDVCSLTNGQQHLGAADYGAHMLGLQRMVEVRGGLRALRSDQFLHNNLCL